MTMFIPKHVVTFVASVLVTMLLLPSAGRAETVDERLFLVYALEDLYRTTWPADRRRVMSSQEVRLALEGRRLQVERLRRQIEARTKDEELLSSLKDYLTLLNKAETLAGLLKQREDAYYVYFSRLRQEVLGTKFVSQTQVTLQTIDGASDAMSASFRNPFSGGLSHLASGLFAGLTSYAMAQARHQIRMTAAMMEADAKARAYEADQGPKFRDDLKNLSSKFFLTFDKEKLKACEEATKQMESLAKKYAWTPSDFAFDPNAPLARLTPADQPRNPFRIKSLVLEQKREQDPKVLLPLAEECLRAATLVPAISNEVYKQYQGEFYELAGYLANQAAQAELGSVGFKEAQTNPAKAAATAQQAWKLYFSLKTEGSLNGPSLHQYVLALAYGGKLTDALALINKSNLPRLRSGDPAFWFDVARILSVVGGNQAERAKKNRDLALSPLFMQNLNSCQTQALYCLRMAVGTGLPNKESLRIHPDLEWIRRVSGDGFGRAIGLPNS